MSSHQPEQPIPEPKPETKQRLAYHRELEELAAGVLRLGAMACETIPRGTEVLLGGNLADAQTVIDGDDEIDALTVELEEKCYSIIALQAPMAGELRRLIAISKLVAEIERSADLMVNICKASRRMYGAELTPRIRGVLSSMSKEANKLLRLSLDAFADENVSLAAALGDIDDKLDQLNRDIVEEIFEAHAAESIDLGAAVQLALIARYFERIGDHAVNIGERVTYMVTGWLPEHDGMLRVQNRAGTKDPQPVVSDDPSS
ncbi:MAG: phosphate signaling complex protein PhoU [Acidimicrobiales bacterium]